MKGQSLISGKNINLSFVEFVHRVVYDKENEDIIELNRAKTLRKHAYSNI